MCTLVDHNKEFAHVDIHCGIMLVQYHHKLHDDTALYTVVNHVVYLYMLIQYCRYLVV